MADFGIYTGFWWDYSAGAGVLTLPISSAAYLISGLTLLVSLAGLALWMMVAYVWHQSNVAADGPVDYQHLQLQVLLRNVTTPASALVHAAKLMLKRPPMTGSSHRSHLLVLALTAGLIMALFGMASVFVGAAVASPSQEDNLVLAEPIFCGEVLMAPINASASGETFSTIFAAKARQTFRAREYAKAWYAANGSLATAGSTAYPVRRLPYTTSRVPCPFPGNRCRFSVGNGSDVNTAISFDTGLLDSSLHLGINGPIDRSVQFRRKTTCMPISGRDMYEHQYVINGLNYTVLRAGPNESEGNTGNITLKYDERMNTMELGYFTGAVLYNPFPDPPGSWRPIPLLARNDSTVTLFNILPNNVNYAVPVHDPIFFVSGAVNYTVPDPPLPNRTIYMSDYFISTLVCHDQFQICKPQSGVCTPETYPVAAMRGATFDLGLNTYQLDIMFRIANILSDTDMFVSGPGNLGVSALLANEAVLRNGLSPALPPDQWIREVRLWFETGLAVLQERTLLWLDMRAFNTSDGAFRLDAVAQRTDVFREPGEWACANQKVRARLGQAQNFSVVRLVVVVVVAVAVLVLGWLLEPCVALVRRLRRRCGWCSGDGQMRQFARATDNLYWLLHAGLRGAGAAEYPWRYGDADEDGEEGVVRDEEVPMLDVPGQFWPPVNHDGSWAPFYRCPLERSVDDLLADPGACPEMSAHNGQASYGRAALGTIPEAETGPMFDYHQNYGLARSQEAST